MTWVPVRWVTGDDHAALFDGREITISSNALSWWNGTPGVDRDAQVANWCCDFLHECAHAYDLVWLRTPQKRKPLADALGQRVENWLSSNYQRSGAEAFARAFVVEFCDLVPTVGYGQDLLRTWRIPIGGEDKLPALLGQPAPSRVPALPSPVPARFDPAENPRDWVQLAYRVLLRRDPEPAGWSYWSGVTATYGLGAVWDAIAVSDEARARWT